MTIDLDTKKLKVLKKILGKQSVQEDIERIVNDWVDSVISTHYRNNKHLTEMVDELDLTQT